MRRSGLFPADIAKGPQSVLQCMRVTQHRRAWNGTAQQPTRYQEMETQIRI